MESGLYIKGAFQFISSKLYLIIKISLDLYIYYSKIILMIKKLLLITLISIMLIYMYIPITIPYYIDYDSDFFEYEDPWGSIYGRVEVYGYFDQPFEYYTEEYFSRLEVTLNPSILDDLSWMFFYYSENNVTCDSTSVIKMCDKFLASQGNCSPRYFLDEMVYNEIRHYVYSRLEFGGRWVENNTYKTWIAEASIGKNVCGGGGCPLIYIEIYPGLFLSIGRIPSSRYGPSITLMKLNSSMLYVWNDTKIRIIVGSIIPYLRNIEFISIDKIYLIGESDLYGQLVVYPSKVYLLGNEKYNVSSILPGLILSNPSIVILEFNVEEICKFEYDHLYLYVSLNWVIK